jgi:hypothetical protein
MRRAVILIALIAVGLAHAVSAQNGPGGSSALGTTAKPNSIIPRSTPPPAATQPWKGKFLPDGQPELPQGIWRAFEPQTRYIDRPPPGAIMASRVVDPPDGLIPYQPWAREIKKTQNDDLEHPTKPWHVDTQGRCLNTVPRLMHYLTPYAVHQAPGMIVFQYELEHLTRVIPLDGSKHIGAAIKLWMGDARGHWEGNTLVVDTTNLNGIARLSSSGDFLTSNAHLKERLTYLDGGMSMTYEATIEDPTVFTRPWTIRVAHKLDVAPAKPGQDDLDDEIVEYMCYEGESEGVPSTIPETVP